MASKERLYLIDGTALAYRSFFALIRTPLMNSKGLNTSAAFGFVNELLRSLEKDKPDYLAVVFDPPGPTFRHEQFQDYKATREKMPDEMGWQLPYIDRIVTGLGIKRLQIAGFEADDVIGTLAVKGAAADLDVVIVTGDKDFMQLVTDRVKIRNPWGGDPSRLYGAKEVEQKLGVPPERVRDLLGLMGDSSDNIPGVPGVGPKTALKLLEQFGSLEAALDGADEVKAKRARENLKTHRDDAILSKELVTIALDAPVDLEVSELRVAEPNRADLVEIFAELEFLDLQKRFMITESAEPLEHTLVEPDDAAAVAAMLEELRAGPWLVLDVELTDPDPHRGELAGIALCASASRAFYVPAYPDEAAFGSVRAEPRFSGRFADAMASLAPLLEDAAVPKGGHDLKRVVHALARSGVTLGGAAFDTLIEAHLLDPSLRQNNTDDHASRFLAYKKRTSRALKRGEERDVAGWAEAVCEDAIIGARLHEHFAEKLDEEGLTETYRDVDIPLLSVLVAMERRGIAIDTELLGSLSVEFAERAAETEREILELAGGEPFKVNSPKQLSEVLFERMEIQAGYKKKPRKTKTGAFSTDEATLRNYADHPIVAKIFDHRAILKLKSTYVDALPAIVHPITGRLHTSYNQAGAATGRLASTNPNLQNIPIRTAEGRRIREAFIADPGRALLSADYSQIELRLMAHFTGDAALIDAFAKGEDIHRTTAARVFDKEPKDVGLELRSRAKAINYGVPYGMGPTALAASTGLSMNEARDFIASYFEKFPAVKRWLDDQVEEAREDGFVETILGRKRLLPEIYASNPMVRSNAERVAVNTPLQGSAADLIKVAMIRIEARLAGGDADALDAWMLLSVHDELVFSVPEGREEALAEVVRVEMEGAIELKVPLKVDVGWGPTWLDAH